MMKPKALILFAPGTNRNPDVEYALQLAGAETETRPLKWLRESAQDWAQYQMLVLPGGFAYADALGAGKLMAIELSHYFHDQVTAFVEARKPVIGICNGFQTLVKAGILPQGRNGAEPWATLTFNQRNHFECRWVTIEPVSKRCIWTQDLDTVIDCPVAHGEGNFQLSQPEHYTELVENDQVALVYARPDGAQAQGAYPFNPNGSYADIAGVCNVYGNVLGLMPHPEDHVLVFQGRDQARRPGNLGLPLFVNGVRYAQGR